MDKKAILVVSHGSRSNQSYNEVQNLIDQIKNRFSDTRVESAFLEINEPDISKGIDLCVDGGATEIIVLLNFLNSGRHVLEHIPEILEDSKKKYPNINITQTECVGLNSKMLSVYEDIISKNLEIAN